MSSMTRFFLPVLALVSASVLGTVVFLLNDSEPELLGGAEKGHSVAEEGSASPEAPGLDAVPPSGTRGRPEFPGPWAGPEGAKRGETWKRLVRALSDEANEDPLSALEAFLREGFPPGAAVHFILNSLLDEEERWRLLQFLVAQGGCSRADLGMAAEYYLELARNSEGILLLERAFALCPDDPWILEALAERNPQAALALLAGVDPSTWQDVWALRLAIRLLQKNGASDSLEAYARRLLALHSCDPTAIGVLIDIDPDALLAGLEQAVAREPGNSGAWSALGAARLISGRFQEAFEAYSRACDLDPDSPENLQGLIEIDPDRALAVLKSLAEKDPENVEALGKLGRALSAAGRKEEAFANAWKALEMEPEDPEWMDLLLETDPLKTLAGLRAMAQERPGSDIWQGHLGRALLAAGDRDSSFEAYQCAFQLGSYPVWAHGMVEADPRRAVPALQSSMGLTPERYSALLADISRPPSPEGEEDAWDRAYSPRNYSLFGELGLALVGADRFSEGARFIEFALESGHVEGRQASELVGALCKADPAKGRARLDRMEREAGSDAESWGRIGDGYRAMGMYPEALRAYRRARRLDPADEEWITAVGELESRNW